MLVAVVDQRPQEHPTAYVPSPVGITDWATHSSPEFTASRMNSAGESYRTLSSPAGKALLVRAWGTCGTTAGGGLNVILLFGGHLATEQDWGVNGGASQFPGSSAQIAVLDFSGGGNDDTASINPQGIRPQSLSISDVTVLEGDSGTTTATLSVTLDPPSTFLVTVDWATSRSS